jgi:hypothetical protein
MEGTKWKSCKPGMMANDWSRTVTRIGHCVDRASHYTQACVKTDTQ